MPLNVLVTAGSRRVPLVQAFQRALRESGGEGRVIVTDVNGLSPAVHVADRAFRVPLAGDPDYVPALEQICRNEGIRLLIPTIDDELSILAEATARFARIGVLVAVSPVETADICNDKFRTSAHLRDRGVAAATAWLPGELPRGLPLPLFVKPRRGRGSVAAFPARTARELDFFAGYVEDAVVQEYLEGPEFTIDMLCDASGTPMSIVPRERVVIRAGVTDRGRTTRDQSLIDLGARCAAALRFFGAVNVQCRVVDGCPTVFEINPRFSGGIPLTIEAGADFPRMLLDIARGREVRPSIGVFADGLWMTSYESSIFLRTRDANALAPHHGRRLEVA